MLPLNSLLFIHFFNSLTTTARQQRSLSKQTMREGASSSQQQQQQQHDIMQTIFNYEKLYEFSNDYTMPDRNITSL